MSRFDYRDPGTDPDYCDGLAPDLDEPRDEVDFDDTADDEPRCPVCDGAVDLYGLCVVDCSDDDDEDEDDHINW